ncbi:hypothetical protein N657DRAFT_637831 [Parathielavia appendiculata]|uniref:Uncharacterized protein n=1 Tax=Parathielavia appendiculata TaxID=2587402 RepID=A0AAN6TQ99_9PEZI|nr:hypothetical protein N657DRAFT_637831 [Parathielavia appendiculata]
MSARALLNTTAKALHPSPISLTARRSLTQTTRAMIKENASTDPDPEAMDRHKQDSVSKAKKGEGHWKPELASVSEESVKADRAATGDSSDAAMRRLQEQTKAHAEETSKNRTSMRDGL